jgi:hypothetical protein
MFNSIHLPKWRLARYYTKISIKSVGTHVADHFFLFSILWLGIHNLFISFTMIIKLMEMGRVSFDVMGHK